MGLLSVTDHEADRTAAPNAVAPVPHLDDAEPQARRVAARSMRGDAAKVPMLLSSLQREADLSVRQAILDALVATGGPEATDGLAALLRSEDAHLRNEAIAALAELPEAAGACITRMLKADDPDVRIFTVNVLRDLRHPATSAWLSQAIAEDTHPNVVGTALDHALEVADPSMRNAVESARTRFAGDRYIDFVCGLLLRRIDGMAP